MLNIVLSWKGNDTDSKKKKNTLLPFVTPIDSNWLEFFDRPSMQTNFTFVDFCSSVFVFFKYPLKIPKQTNNTAKT